ncbi:MAG: hypothetical protein ABIV50_12570 [Opitutus sp.]
MNPARLAELRHQRSLVQEQLAWLDREIATEVGDTAPAPASSRIHATAEVNSTAVPELESYVPDPISAAAQTRRGCLVALAFGLLATIAGLTAIYLLKYRDRPLIFPSVEAPASTSPLKSK